MMIVGKWCHVMGTTSSYWSVAFELNHSSLVADYINNLCIMKLEKVIEYWYKEYWSFHIAPYPCLEKVSSIKWLNTDPLNGWQTAWWSNNLGTRLVIIVIPYLLEVPHVCPTLVHFQKIVFTSLTSIKAWQLHVYIVDITTSSVDTIRSLTVNSIPIISMWFRQILRRLTMGRYIKQPHLRSAFGAKRVILVAACFAVFIFFMMYAEFSRGNQPRSAIPHSVPKSGEGSLKFDSPGAAIAPKLGNETARYD